MLLTIIVFFLILGLIVLVHELGHFVTARRAGVKVEEFGLGLPPRALGFYKDDNGKWKPVGLKSKEAPKTIWSLNWIPLGGFVKIKGEEGGDANDPDSFGNKSIWQRIWILSAGVSMNIILAAVLLTIGLTIGSPQAIDEDNIPAVARVSDVNIRIMEVLPDSPAATAGIEVADAIVQVDGQVLTKITDFQNYFDSKVGQEVSLQIKRDEAIIETTVIPEILEETERGGMGVALIEIGIVSYPWYLAPAFGVWETLKLVGNIFLGFYLVIKSLLISQELIGEVYGPVGIASLVGDALQLGFLYLIQFTAVLSVIIAVINYLPIPALDGGRVMFLLIEKVRGKSIKPKIETAAHNIGFALLMLLVLVVTFRDISRITNGFLGFWDKISGLL
ncbi:MAG: RIP metalloprotease RseP [Parcubacteria group bacterium]|nr:RIP metalloprotease RseP [Parcubacteria group bacterium]|tara:strand:- start:16571 stop:17740 length:1170 start_codon:yes stop_codon:yes gene_type:complete